MRQDMNKDGSGNGNLLNDLIKDIEQLENDLLNGNATLCKCPYTKLMTLIGQCTLCRQNSNEFAQTEHAVKIYFAWLCEIISIASSSS